MSSRGFGLLDKVKRAVRQYPQMLFAVFCRNDCHIKQVAADTVWRQHWENKKVTDYYYYSYNCNRPDYSEAAEFCAA
jgi:hypothetical protein